MDTGTYPDEKVKAFLNRMVVMKINPEAGKEWKKVAESFEVNSFPRLIVLTPQGAPKGEKFIEKKGRVDGPEFEGAFTSTYWNEFAEGSNAKPQDMKAMAEGLFVLVAWFPETEKGKKAATRKAELEKNDEFKKRWEELQGEHDRGLAAAKADAQLKLGKKKEAIETYKEILAKFAGSKEAESAAAALKKLGVKVEALPEEKK